MRPNEARPRQIPAGVAARRRDDEDRIRAQQVVEHIQTAILVAVGDPDDDRPLTVATANPAAVDVFGLDADALHGVPLTALLDGADDTLAVRAADVARGGAAFTVDGVTGLGSEANKTFSVQVFPLPGGAAAVALDDVTGTAMVAAALRRQALHDGLTGLPNRTLFRDRLRHAMAGAKRNGGRVALVLLDLNHFKDVNDVLGHHYGDRLLTGFAKRLGDTLRECDTVARLGGDEFAVVVTDATFDGAAHVAQKVTDAMTEPFDLDGVTVLASTSLGVALYPDHAEDEQTLSHRADLAMYTAKRNGGGWRIYSPDHDDSSVQRLVLLADLRHELTVHQRTGVAPDGMRLRHQPIVDLGSGTTVAVEAELCWDHPTAGRLDPTALAELASLTGLIGDLTALVARNTLTAVARRGAPAGVVVNLAPRNLYDDTLPADLVTLVGDIGLPVETLTCQIAESTLVDDPDLAEAMVGRLRDVGIGTSIDRVGAGASSLTHLRRLPVDELEIDASFVRALTVDPGDLAIVRTVIDLGHHLGLRVGAAGVDDAAAADTLRELGCDRGQGAALVDHWSPDLGIGTGVGVRSDQL